MKTTSLPSICCHAALEPYGENPHENMVCCTHCGQVGNYDWIWSWWEDQCRHASAQINLYTCIIEISRYGTGWGWTRWGKNEVPYPEDVGESIIWTADDAIQDALEHCD